MAGSAAFATPFGYQTNVIVYQMGGYSYMDFVRVGLPLNLITWAAAMIAIPLFLPVLTSKKGDPLRSRPSHPQALQDTHEISWKRRSLLQLDRAASGFDLRLDLLGFVLVDAFLDGFGAPSTRALASPRPSR